MEELKGIYQRQALVERRWRLSKDPKLMVDALFLNNPSRVAALLWIKTLAILITVVTEHLVRKAMLKSKATIYNPDKTVRTLPLTYKRLHQLFYNGASSFIDTGDLDTSVLSNLGNQERAILNQLGCPWTNYYNEEYIFKALRQCKEARESETKAYGAKYDFLLVP